MKEKNIVSKKSVSAFTLIELLAVIVILAVVAVITVPIITGVIDNVKKQAFTRSVESSLKAFELLRANSQDSVSRIDVTDDRLPLEHNKFLTGTIMTVNKGEMEAYYLYDGTYCGSGTLGNITVKKGPCEESFSPIGNIIMKSYVLTIDPNGGTYKNSSEKQNINILMDEVNSLENPVKAGYKFAGFDVTVTGHIEDGDNGFLVTTLKARWEENATLNLLINPNGGKWNNSTLSQNLTKLSGSETEITVPTRTGYTFNGWIITGEGSSINNNKFTMGTENTELKADWVANSYTITINPNGGIWNYSSDTISSQREYGSDITIANPTKAGYAFTGWTLSGAGSISGKTLTIGEGNTTLTANWVQSSTAYAYKEEAQEFVAPISGWYKIELNGAQGTTGYSLGGYTKGEIYLSKGEKLYIYVGGQSKSFNGASTGTRGTISGGATDVRYFGSDIPTAEELLWNSTLGLNSRIMVAAGGGADFVETDYDGDGHTRYGYGGPGGGINGSSGVNGWGDRQGQGGTQKAGGGFGFGVTGGGGGYYGGYRNGGGGSSFISGHVGCIAISSKVSRTPKCSTGQDVSCATHYSGKVFIHTITNSGANTGNGSALITLLDDRKNEQNMEYTYTNDYEEYTVLKTGTYLIELWGAQGTSSYSLGGYTKGEIYLTENEKLYVYVGGKNQPFNGGSTGTRGTISGGATDIRLVSGPWNEPEGLDSRIMVAAGGGADFTETDYDGDGHTRYGYGGPGGGINGSSGINGWGDRQGQGGTQKAGGGFGFGVTGGGGGYYGGYRNGGGGSSFISGHLGCIAITSTGVRTAKCGSGDSIECATHYSGKVFTNTSTTTGTNEGNGKAKITFIS